MAVSGDDIQAVCYLYKEGDEKNKALLTADKLYIIHRKRPFEFELANIKGFSFNVRKLMAPLITGGVTASLSFVALFKDVFDPYVVAFTLTTGLLLFYYGWTGQLVFTVSTRIKDYDFSIPGITDNLKAFTGFLTGMSLIGRKAGSQPLTFFVFMKKEEWSKARDHAGDILLHPKPFRLYTRDQAINRRGNDVAIEIDPLKTNHGVKYIRNPRTGRLAPHLMGDLNRDAIVRVEESGR